MLNKLHHHQQKVSRFIFQNGTPDAPGEAEPLPSAPTEASPLPTSPNDQPEQTLNEAAKIIDGATQQSGRLNASTEYSAQEFTPEEMARKTKGYPEVSQNSKNYKEVETLLGVKFPDVMKERGATEHGDTTDFEIDYETGSVEYIVLKDESKGSAKYRLFSSKKT